MSVHCAYCGEEMMGAVNRCWRCGRRFANAPTPASEPPVRRSPIPGPLYAPPQVVSRYGFEAAVVADAVVVADAADAPTDPPTSGAADLAASLDDLSLGRLRRVEQSDAQRLGSPFDQSHRPGLFERVRIGARWIWENVRAGWQSWRRRMTKAATPQPAPASSLSPLRRALANSSLFLSLTLAVIAWCLTSYAIIAVGMAVLGLALATVSVLAAPRWRVAVPSLLCIVLLLSISYDSYVEWNRQQMIKQGLVPLEGLEDAESEEES